MSDLTINPDVAQVEPTVLSSFLIVTLIEYHVGIKINYHLLTSIYVTSILSYTVLEDDANDEK
ncbi:XXYS1_4_G0027240.mRNA.1.CDS.1 [Saccharomyces cerevisiae]|nr:XXYS1_4_G0027240.mRNA.1.CDS.1 [Saccharomyces cerevisiae]